MLKVSKITPKTDLTRFTSFSGNLREVVGEEARDATFTEIPLISLNAEKRHLVAQIKKACTEIGFFYIEDHGISQGLIDDLVFAARSFFKLSDKDKNEIHFKKSKHLRGYEGFGDNQTEQGRKPDLNEQFNWGYEPTMDPEMSQDDIEKYLANQDKNLMYGPNCWPSKVPELKSAVERYYSEVLNLARKLMSLFALALNLPEDYFSAFLKNPGAMGRVLHYLPQPVDSQDQLGIGAHTDIECCTILYAGMVPALQILNAQGEWIVATPIPGTFVINIGDLLARWTNDFFISTVHRVKNMTGVERYSVPVFVGVDYETVIEPLRTCIGPEGAKYPPIKAGDYVFKRLAYSRFEETDYSMMLEDVGVK